MAPRHVAHKMTTVLDISDGLAIATTQNPSATIHFRSPKGARWARLCRYAGHVIRIRSGIASSVKLIPSPAGELSRSEPPPDLKGLLCVPVCEYGDDCTNEAFPGLCWFAATGCRPCREAARGHLQKSSSPGWAV